MRRKLLVLILVPVFLLSFLLVGCNEKEKVHVIFLGDSIGEGIAGMRPVSERERDAYYGVLGIRNGYDFKNRAISGSKSGDLLAYIQREDEGIRMTQSLIRTADIIHVSILGNDLLLSDIGRLITSVANNDYKHINSIVSNAESNIAQIVEILKGYNSDALLIIQTVYNPIYEGNTLISEQSRAALAELGIYEDQYRELAGNIVEMVNAVVHDYLEAHPGAFYIADGYKAFDDIYNEDPVRGKKLIFVDDAHPSAEGHGIMADINQTILEETGYANARTALKNYKEMRIAQLERLYSDTVDVKAVSKTINKAKSCAEITEIYFSAIYEKLPDYY